MTVTWTFAYLFVPVGSRSKVTSNVRRILQSQKTFRNYLDDEEAALAHAAQQTTVQRPSISKVSRNPTRTFSSHVGTEASRGAGEQRKWCGRPSLASQEANRTAAHSTGKMPASEANDNQLIKSEYDNDPLLRSYTLSAPSDRIMKILLAEPPLNYHAARAGAPMSAEPGRNFCCMCGYWGKIRCKSCHLRTCGLECYKIHEDSRCGAFF